MVEYSSTLQFQKMINPNHKSLSGFTFIDLFAGLGGFRLALESLGATCVFASEIDKHARQVYKDNFNHEPDGDITKISESSIPHHDILCAGFPCQAFSISGKQMGFEDVRGTLFFDIARIVKERKPKVVFLENVRNFEKHDNGKTLKVVASTMKELGYSFFYKVLSASDFNIPQKRERIYMVCFRNDLNVDKFSFPSSIPLTRHVKDFLLDEPLIPNSLYVDRKDIIISNKKDDKYSNKPIRIGIVNKGGQGERIYSTKGVAITLSAHGGGVFSKTGGYLINGKYRKLAPRECARLMGYPDTYKLSNSPHQAYKQFGNSVVIDVLQYIAIEFAKKIK